MTSRKNREDAVFYLDLVQKAAAENPQLSLQSLKDLCKKTPVVSSLHGKVAPDETTVGQSAKIGELEGEHVFPVSCGEPQQEHVQNTQQFNAQAEDFERGIRFVACD